MTVGRIELGQKFSAADPLLTELAIVRANLALLNRRVSRLIANQPQLHRREWQSIRDFVHAHYPQSEWPARAKWIRRRLHPVDKLGTLDHAPYTNSIRARRCGRNGWQINTADALRICGFADGGEMDF